MVVASLLPTRRFSGGLSDQCILGLRRELTEDARFPERMARTPLGYFSRTQRRVRAIPVALLVVDRRQHVDGRVAASAIVDGFEAVDPRCRGGPPARRAKER